MNLNQATDYAFRAVLYLANKPRGEAVEAHEIALRQVVPMRFLLKIMPSLVKSGIIKSKRGVGGGYYLAKHPKDISFLDVVEAVEGPVAINRCLVDAAYCSRKGASNCQVHRALQGIQEKLVAELKRHNFGDLDKL